MICSNTLKRHKKDKQITLRPLSGGIRTDEDACDFLGSKEDLGFLRGQ